ncbi:hypothetical protein L915_21441 [Phytophthora nicotianae]|uniref:Uncharacterized protein n=1 Tax=Phytophthora nicotianae TaxID=4792 RepID=W2FMY3_PHYNI|nr:hypothetical protein L915_21441 [Phytophthora nicotianae]
MAQKLRNARWHLREAWVSIQVEYQGSYSAERLRQLGCYMDGLNTRRILLVCALTPLPCLVLSLLKETPPLSPAEAGVYKNGVFFVRSWVIMCFMGASALVQMGHGAPRLKLTKFQIVWVSLLAATVSILFIFGLCVLTVFPLPFGLLIAGPPFVIVIAACFTYISGHLWRTDPSILVDVKRQLVVYNCQTTLPFVYPLYILGFVSLTGVNQVVFVAVLPIIQIVAKNWISRALADDHDQKPQCVIFVVEVYNALYVSNVLQTATSWASTATIMAVDLLQFWVSMIDMVKLLKEVNLLMRKIPPDHPCAKENFVQVAVRLLNTEQHQNTIGSTAGTMYTEKKMPMDVAGSKNERSTSAATLESYRTCQDGRRKERWMILQKARVVPCSPPTQHSRHQNKQHLGPIVPVAAEGPQIPTKYDLSGGLEQIFSRKERARFVRRSAHLLFIIEYLVLVEYVEVVLPFVYCLHQFILFHMPNSAHYPALAGLSREEFTAKMLSTLLYSFFELGSFVMMVIVLKRRLGYSGLQQLAFVLDVYASVVQTKLNLIFVYIMQVSLDHHGADFTFKFAWLNSKRKF